MGDFGNLNVQPAEFLIDYQILQLPVRRHTRLLNLEP
jgi:hypothetical protein